MVQFDCIEKPLSRLFYVYGRFIARHPIWFLVCPLILTAALGSGFVKFQSEYNVEKLFSPEGARSKDERSIMQDLFSESERSVQFNANRMTTLGEYGRMIVTSKETDGNVLTTNVVVEVEQLDKDIRNMIVQVGGKKYSYRDLCAGSCENATDALLRMNVGKTIDLSLLSYPVHWIPQGPGSAKARVFLGSTIGGVTTEGGTKAKAWSLFYYLRSDNNYTEIVKKWQEAFLSTLENKSRQHITVTRFTAHSLEDELKRNSDAVFPLFSILFTVLITFSIVSCMSADWVRSKPWLGNLGVLSAGLAVVSAFGLVLYIGVPFIDIVASSPFLVLGIGVDDMFVMLAAWRQTDFRLSVEERMGKAFSEAALSITITSLTDALSISIGAITKFRSVQIFCTYTAIAVLFDYFYQITFFAACMVLTGHREASNRHPATCMKAVPKSKAEHRNAIFRLFCTGGYTEVEAIDASNTADVRAMAFFRDSWGRLLSTRPFKIFLLHVYLVYIGFAIWGCLTVNEGITLDRLAGDGSYVADYYDQDIKYFREYGPVVSVNVGKELKLWDMAERNKIEKIIQEFETSEYFHDQNLTSAWTRDFSTFTESDGVDSGNFSEILDYFLSNYSRLNYDLDIKTDSNNVKYSRFFVVSKNIETSIRESKMMLAARAIADNHTNLNMTVFHPAFIFYDQYLAVWPNTRQNLLIATAAMFVVSLFLIPHPVCSLWVTCSIVSICTGVIGYMTWWDVNLDTISMINIIICIGFCVDFSAHITYAFVSADGDTGNQRMRNALHALGYPIAQGALSTILGVTALAFSASYIFRTFFKTMFLVILLGAFHGLLFIPALLSIMGPPKLTKKRHSVSPMNPPRLHPIADGVDGWIHRDLDRVEPDHGMGAPIGHQDDFPPTLPVRPRKAGSPMRYCSIPNKSRNGDLGMRNNPAPMPYANGDLPPRYEVSGHHNGWPGGRSQDPYIGSPKYIPPLTNLGRPQDNYAGPDEYRHPLRDLGRLGGNYVGRHDYKPAMSDDGPPRYRVGSPGGHQMANGWSQY